MENHPASSPRSLSLPICCSLTPSTQGSAAAAYGVRTIRASCRQAPGLQVPQRDRSVVHGRLSPQCRRSAQPGLLRSWREKATSFAPVHEVILVIYIAALTQVVYDLQCDSTLYLIFDCKLPVMEYFGLSPST